MKSKFKIGELVSIVGHHGKAAQVVSLSFCTELKKYKYKIDAGKLSGFYYEFQLLSRQASLAKGGVIW